MINVSEIRLSDGTALANYPRYSGEIGAVNTVYPRANVKRYGVIGDGIANDLFPIRSAVNSIVARGGGDLIFPPGQYNLGPSDGSHGYIRFIGAQNITVYAYGATFICNSSSGVPTAFLMDDPINFCWFGGTIHDIAFTGTDTGQDSGGDGAGITWHGAAGLSFRTLTETGPQLGNIVVRDLTTYNLMSSVLLQGLFYERRIKNVDLEFATSESFYGLNCQAQGDNLRARIDGRDVRRIYFPFGVKTHDVNITYKSTQQVADNPNATSNALCDIKRYGRDTKDIRIRLNVTGDMWRSGSLVNLEHQPWTGTGPSTIRDIDIEINVNDLYTESSIGSNPLPIQTVPVNFRSYVGVPEGDPEGLASVEETVSTDNVWTGISVKGNIGSLGSNLMKFGCRPNVEGTISLAPNMLQGQSARLPHYPNFVVRTAHDEEFRTLVGNLTTQTIVIPCAGYDSTAFTLKMMIYAHDTLVNIYEQNSIYREDILVCGNGAGASNGVGVYSTTNGIAAGKGTPPTVTYTGVGENIVVSFAGAPYTNADSYARVGVKYVSRGPFYKRVAP